jgi:hypothetical protein
MDPRLLPEFPFRLDKLPFLEESLLYPLLWSWLPLPLLTWTLFLLLYPFW